MRWVAANFDVLPLPDAVRALREDRLPKRALSITFDDGYADNHDLALPVLRRLGISATFFIATGYLDGGCMFNDIVIESVRAAPGPELDLEDLRLGRHPLGSDEERVRAIARILDRLKRWHPDSRHAVACQLAERAGATVPTDLMMTSGMVRALATAGMAIGAHTVTHPILAQIELDEARAEISDSRRRLEEITGAPVRLFAYPNGKPLHDYRPEHARLVRDLGFDAAVSTAWGAAGAGDDLYQIPRFTPWDRPNWRYGLRLTGNLLKASYASG
jgi:peptidoglycan/xylan/chitin deacetylase (PgdA/CDA1 family)